MRQTARSALFAGMSALNLDRLPKVQSSERLGTRRRPPTKVRPYHANTQVVTLAAGEIESNFRGVDIGLQGSINWTNELLGTSHRAPRSKS